MQGQTPAPYAEPELPESSVSGPRVSAYLLLTAMLLAGGWMRFGDRIADFAHTYYGMQIPMAASPMVQRSANAMLVEMPMVPDSQAAAAAAAMGLSAHDLDLLTTALKQDRVRLVTLPVFDTGPPGAGHVVQVSAGGYTRTLTLTAAPQAITLPLSAAATVSFRLVGGPGGPVGMGALTITGPVKLPPIAPGDLLQVGVMAQ